MGKSNWWSHPGMRLAFLRQLHTYVGAFIAPSVLFFALTGALQLFHFHEAHGDYAPPPVIEKLGRLHKDQVFEPGHKKAKPQAATAKAGAAHDDEDHDAAPAADHDHDAGQASAAAHDHDAAKAPAAAQDHDADHDHGPKRGEKLGTTLLKWMFLFVALGLAVSTCLGVWMGAAHSRNKAVVWALLILGAVAPVVLLLL